MMVLDLGNIKEAMMPIDYSKYPPDWKDRVERIRKRSGDRCEVCGLKNKAIVYSVPFAIRHHEGSLGKSVYKTRRIWFSSRGDAIREASVPNLVKPVKVILTVAHMDHDEENWDVSDDRLMHMCQVCHLRYDAKEKYRRAISK